MSNTFRLFVGEGFDPIKGIRQSSQPTCPVYFAVDQQDPSGNRTYEIIV